MSARYQAVSRTPQFRANLETDHSPTLQHYAEQLKRNEGATSIFFRDASGRVRASAGDGSLDPPNETLERSSLIVKGGVPYVVTSVLLKTKAAVAGTLIVAERIPDEVVALWRNADRDTERRARAALLAGVGVSLGAGLFSSFFLWRGVVGPLQQVAQAAREIGQGAFTARVGLRRADELGEVANVIDEMAERIEDHDNRLNSLVAERTRELEAATKDAVAMAEKAIQSGRAKMSFLANISHELRTPMNGVIGMLDLLQLSGMQGEQQRMAETAASSSRMLLTLVDEILDYSKLEAGKMQFDASPFDLRELVKETTAFLESSATRKGLSLSVDVDADLPACVAGDAARIRQVLTNLIGNAVKFTEDGSIRVECTRATGSAPLDQSSPAFKAVISVVDTGIGVPAGEIERLFEPFTQADESSARRSGGTGLGLSISRALVEQMGGELNLENREAGGTRAFFSLPLAESDADPVSDPSEPGESEPITSAAVLRGAEVLVVEDNAVNREVTVAALRHFECEPVPADGGRTALAIHDFYAFDLILLDCQMPDIDGYEVARTIKAREQEVETPTPIIALTAHASASDRQKCLAAGMDDYMSKPFDLEELRAIMVKWLTKGEPRPEPVVARKRSRNVAQALDPSVIAGLRVLDSDGDLLKRVIDIFLRDAPVAIEKLSQAIQSAKAESIQQLAHALKSSSGNMGATRIRELAQRLETMGDNGELANAESDLTELRSAFDTAKVELEELRSEYQPALGKLR